MRRAVDIRALRFIAIAIATFMVLALIVTVSPGFLNSAGAQGKSEEKKSDGGGGGGGGGGGDANAGQCPGNADECQTTGNLGKAGGGDDCKGGSNADRDTPCGR